MLLASGDVIYRLSEIDVHNLAIRRIGRPLTEYEYEDLKKRLATNLDSLAKEIVKRALDGTA